MKLEGGIFEILYFNLWIILFDNNKKMIYFYL